MNYIADNDNQMMGVTVRTPAEHAAIVATCGKDARPVLAWPTLSRLRGKPELARALVDYAKLMEPHRSIELSDIGDEDEDEPADTDDMGIDCLQEIKPSERQMLIAAARGSFTVMSDGTTIRSHDAQGRRSINTLNHVTTMRLGDLHFNGVGALRQWRTSTSRWMKPVELLRAPKGKKKTPRDPADVRRLVANDNVPIAKGALFVGGMTRSRGNVTASGRGEHLASLEQERTSARTLVRNALSKADLMALDLAVSDSTAEEIGEAFGARGKSAERIGVRKTDEALSEFMKIAA